jgi:carboxypeptidase family protein/TonB-dependent receptor-like protein
MPRVLRSLFSHVCVVGLLLSASVAFGQAAYTAQVRGVVTDQTGAVVQGAQVTITNDGTGISTTARTDDHGLYTVAGLRPAVYTVKCEAKGFQAAERKNLVLQVDQQTSIDFSLKPPGVLATIEVTAATPPLDTESASIGTDVTNEYVRDIPLYNRSIFGLAFLAGGVTETTGSGVNDNYPSGTNFVSNGQRNATAQITLDGSPISAPEQGEGGNSNVYYQPSVEIVQEFKVQNNSFAAEYGNNGGTLVNIVLKQGTNQIHGSGWWYGQRSATDARDFFNSGEKPDHVRDQYGFAVGGPVVKNHTFFFVDFEKVRQRDPVPIEGVVPTDLERAGDFSQGAANTAGIFDPCPGNTDPNFVCPHNRFPGDKIEGTNPITGQPYIDPIGQAILNLYPHANIADAVFPDPNFRTVALENRPSWQFDVKLDHQITDKHKISGRYSRVHSEDTVPTIVGNGDQGDGIIYLTTAQNGNLEYNWAITPTALWTSRFSVDRVHAPGISNKYPTLSDVGLPAILNQNGLDRIPAINVGDDFLSMFTQCCVDTHFAHTLYSYSSGLQWVKGPHSIKFGGEQRVFFNNFFQPDNPTGIFNFDRNVTTEDPNGNFGAQDEGNPFATMLLGYPNPSDSLLHIIPAVADKSVDTAFYVQDDWKVTPKLTLNLGLRYEWSTPYSERTNQLQFSDFTGSTGFSIPVDRSADFPEFGQIGNLIGTTVFASSSRRNARVDRNNFAPRLGFAFQLANNTVIRGGAGIFYGMNVATNFQYAGPSFSKNAPFYFTQDGFVTQYATLANPFPAGLAPPQGRTYGKLANWGFDNGSDLDTGTARNAEIYQWNLGVQHLLPGQIVVAVDYSANHSVHLPWAGASVSTRERNFLPSSIRNALVASMNPTHNINDTSVSDYLSTPVDNPFQCFFTTVASPGSWCPAAPIFNAADVADSQYVGNQIPQANLLRPYPQFDGGFSGLPRLIATSWYNSLQIRFQKRASHYISFEGNYTLSKSTDDSAAGRNAWLTNLEFDNPQLLDDLKAEHGISANDATHRLATAIILDLPVGRGRWLGSGLNSIADAIVGGWSLESFITLQSGQPLAIVMADGGRLTDGNQRPNVICSQLTTGISFHEAARTGAPYLNEACFADPGDNVPGNAPRHFSNLRGDGIRNLDMSLTKEFKIKERATLQVRAEMFNVANHQRFAFPDVSFGGGFGEVNETRDNFRRMQFGARLQF